MVTPHIFVIVVIFLLFNCNKEIEAPTSSAAGVTSTAAKVQRSQTMGAPSRSQSPRTQSRASSSTSSVSSSHVSRQSTLKEVALQPLVDTVRMEATAQTFSGGHINPSVHGVQSRIRLSILRHAPTFIVGTGLGAGLVAGGKVIANILDTNLNQTSVTTPSTIKIPSTTNADEIENPI